MMCDDVTIKKVDRQRVKKAPWSSHQPHILTYLRVFIHMNHKDNTKYKNGEKIRTYELLLTAPQF